MLLAGFRQGHPTHAEKAEARRHTVQGPDQIRGMVIAGSLPGNQEYLALQAFATRRYLVLHAIFLVFIRSKGKFAFFLNSILQLQFPNIYCPGKQYKS